MIFFRMYRCVDVWETVLHTVMIAHTQSSELLTNTVVYAPCPQAYPYKLKWVPCLVCRSWPEDEASCVLYINITYCLSVFQPCSPLQWQRLLAHHQVYRLTKPIHIRQQVFCLHLVFSSIILGSVGETTSQCSEGDCQAAGCYRSLPMTLTLCGNISDLYELFLCAVFTTKCVSLTLW